MVKITIFFGVFVLVGLGIIFVYSQIIRPITKGTPAFPLFRRRPNIESKIEDVNEKMEDQKLQRELEKKQKQVK